MTYIKCKTCGKDISALTVTYHCPDGHTSDETVERSNPTMNIPPKPQPEGVTENYRFTFGKYKGEELHNVPTDYIQWCLSTLERLDPRIRTQMEEELTLRGLC